MSLLTEVLVITGVAMDLVGAGILAHAHNAESIVELREEIGEDEGTAVGESSALATHAQLLAEKRVGFFVLTLGLVVYLTGLVLKSTEDVTTMAFVAGGVVATALLGSMIVIKLLGRRVRRQAERAEQGAEELPEQ